MGDEGLDSEVVTNQHIADAAKAYVEAWELEKTRGHTLASLLFKRDIESVAYDGYVLKCKKYGYGIEAERHLRVF